mgnify:CR=1 FL=1
MRIDIPSENVIYIEINGYTYYIDDSTNEQIINKWNKRNFSTIQHSI